MPLINDAQAIIVSNDEYERIEKELGTKILYGEFHYCGYLLRGIDLDYVVILKERPHECQ